MNGEAGTSGGTIIKHSIIYYIYNVISSEHTLHVQGMYLTTHVMMYSMPILYLALCSYQSVHLSVCLFVYPSVCLSVCLSVNVPVYLSVYASRSKQD